MQELRASMKLYKVASAAATCLPAIDPAFCVVPEGYLLQVHVLKTRMRLTGEID